MAKREWGGWEGLRNLVMVRRSLAKVPLSSKESADIASRLQGPLTEEIVFRSCIVTVSALAGLSKKQIVFLSPLYFGIGALPVAWG